MNPATAGLAVLHQADGMVFVQAGRDLGDAQDLLAARAVADNGPPAPVVSGVACHCAITR